MNSSQFKKYQFKQFCRDIGFHSKELERIASCIDDNYKEWFIQKTDATTGEFKTYKDGTIKRRTIRASKGSLKNVQAKIKTKILDPISLPSNVHGNVKGHSNVTNAKPHQGKKYQFTTDLMDFYPSIKYNRIYDTFLKLGFSNHYSHWLTKLVSWKGELPQGAPTSPSISNLVFLHTDYVLIEFCNKNGMTYTRYADDITISSAKCFKSLLNDILEIILHSGFKISYRKTEYAGNQNITGIDVYNNYIDAPKKIKDRLTDSLLSPQSRKGYENYLNHIRKTNTNMKRPKTLFLL